MEIVNNKPIFEEYAKIAKALANNNRLEIMSIIIQAEKTVEMIVNDTGLSIANVSKHLQNLLSARLVKNRKYKNYVYYSVANSRIEELLTVFFEVSQEQIDEVNKIKEKFSDINQELDALTIEELDEKMKNNEIMLIDVRPSEEYEHAHIPGAVSIPVNELKSRVANLPENKTIIAYCRGPHCLMSVEALDILKRAGKSAVRLSQGVSDWKLYQKALA